MTTMTEGTNLANEQTVRNFLAAMGPTLEDFKRTYATMLAPDVVWESVGGEPHVGRDACIKHLDDLKAAIDMEYCTIDILNMASNGDVVLTERIDRMHRVDGSNCLGTFEFRIMGAFVVRDGLIARYTDYYDSLGGARALGRI